MRTDHGRTVLLDLDGTLVDSAALITEHLAAAITTAGGPSFTPEQLRTLVGPPFETALPELGLSTDQTAAAITAYRSSYDDVAASHTPLFPGVPELLEQLGVFQLAVATSKPEYLARRIVAGVGIDAHFALVGGADHIEGRVGKSAVVRSVLDRLSIDPARHPVVMVGDRHHDVDGAAEHGIPTIGVAWGYAENGELSGARTVVADMAGVVSALQRDDVWSAAPAAARP